MKRGNTNKNRLNRSYRSAREDHRLSSSRLSRSFPRISRHLSGKMSSLHLTKTCTMPARVWLNRARIPCDHYPGRRHSSVDHPRLRKRRWFDTLVGRDVATTGLFLVRLDCFQKVGADFRVFSHLSIDVSGAENDNLMSSCANLAAAPS